MQRLKEKEIINNNLKVAMDKEQQHKAKFTYLSERNKDKRLRKLFHTFAMTAQSHIAEIEQQMIKLDVK